MIAAEVIIQIKNSHFLMVGTNPRERVDSINQCKVKQSKTPQPSQSQIVIHTKIPSIQDNKSTQHQEFHHKPTAIYYIPIPHHSRQKEQIHNNNIEKTENNKAEVANTIKLDRATWRQVLDSESPTG